MVLLSRPGPSVVARRTTAANAGPTAPLRTRAMRNVNFGGRGAPVRASPGTDPRDARQTDYGSEEVPETWQDEWVSGNRHMDEEDRRATSRRQTESEKMAARSGVNVDKARDESLAGGLGPRDTSAMGATRQAAEGAGEGAGVQDVE